MDYLEVESIAFLGKKVSSVVHQSSPYTALFARWKEVLHFWLLNVCMQLLLSCAVHDGMMLIYHQLVVVQHMLPKPVIACTLCSLNDTMPINPAYYVRQ